MTAYSASLTFVISRDLIGYVYDKDVNITSGIILGTRLASVFSTDDTADVWYKQ